MTDERERELDRELGVETRPVGGDFEVLPSGTAARLEKLERAVDATRTLADMLEWRGPPESRWILNGHVELMATLIGELRMDLRALDSEAP